VDLQVIAATNQDLEARVRISAHRDHLFRFIVTARFG
jgi:transcriptional regulator with GAF, ATPase, and Fis domain